MARIESEPNRVILKDGATTLTLDRAAGKAVLQHKVFFWNARPVEFPLAEIDDIAVKSETDGLSGATLYHSVLHRRSGETTVLTTEEAKDAEATVRELRSFVGL
jgi:hypothetical protein